MLNVATQKGLRDFVQRPHFAGYILRPNMPTDSELESSLRNAVRAHHSNPEVEPTVRSMRTKSEQELGLEEGYYKNHAVWKDKSKLVIQDQFEKCESEQAETKGTQVTEEKKSLKRVSPSTTPGPRKKPRVELQEEEESSTALSEPPKSDEEETMEEEVKPKKSGARQTTKASRSKKVSKPAPQKRSKVKSRKKSPSPELSDASSDDSQNAKGDTMPPKNVGDAEDSSSELSSVIDDPVPTRKSAQAKNGSASKSSKPISRSRSKTTTDGDPKAEEIKRLQGWLVKCGIRKVWGKELKPFTTPNAKISHLKSMLAEVGMTGRFSNEKAAQIKEARELAADIEAVKEGNERWGKDAEEEEEEDQGRGGRRLVRGAKNYAFLSSDGEEESD